MCILNTHRLPGMANHNSIQPKLFQHAVMEYLKNTFQSKDHVEKVIATLMLPPLFTTIRIPIDDDDNRLAKAELQENLLEQCKSMGWSPLKFFSHPFLKDCMVIENRGPNRLEKHPKEIMVDVHCGMAVLRGAHVFKQGIIGAPHGLREGDVVSVYADLDGKCLKGRTALYTGNKIHVGNGIAQVSRSDLFQANTTQSGIGILMTDPLYQAPSLANLHPKLLFPQNLPSIVCSHVLDPQPGDLVLDFCAAPGGKTSHIASLMQKKGRIVALEKSAERVSRMKTLLERIGSSIIEPYVFDSINAVDSKSVPEESPPYPPGTFDRILVDAPCSALGQRPCLVNQLSLNQLKSFPVIQHKLLSVAVQLLKPGGCLVYSTCSLPVEENEDQVHRILQKYPDLDLVKMPFAMGSEGLATRSLTDDQRSLVMRFDPSACEQKDPLPWNVDTIGFFIAKFQKRESGS